MSFKTWTDEFYPKPPSNRMTKKAAIEHSIQKWTGLLLKNLKRHEVHLEGTWLTGSPEDTGGMIIDGDSCALCVKFVSRKYTTELGGCAACPLALYLGNPCDKTGANRPYTSFLTSHDPRPMIKALKATLKKMEE